eukprot:scpid69235/ scgid1463/ 
MEVLEGVLFRSYDGIHESLGSSSQWKLRSAHICDQSSGPIVSRIRQDVLLAAASSPLVTCCIHARGDKNTVPSWCILSEPVNNAFNSIGLDECHEMCINKDLKAAIVHPCPKYIDRLACYLPHREHVLHNIKEELFVCFRVVF